MAQRINTVDTPDDPCLLHFVTLNVRDRKKAFGRPEYAAMVLRELRFECDRHPATLVAYVAMPDHLHFLFGPSDGLVRRFLARFKPGVTLKIDALAQRLGRGREREWLMEKGRRELWQDGKHSVHVRSAEWIRQKIDYIHDNPVRAGLCDHPAHYAWSSHGAYFGASAPPPASVDVWRG